MKNLILLLLTLLFANQLLAEPLDTLKLSKEFDEKIKANIREYLGPEVKFSTFVNVTVKSAAAATANQEAIEIGYVPLPTFKADQEEGALAERIDGISVGVIFYSKLEAATTKEIETLISQSLAPHKVKSTLSIVDPPVLPKKVDPIVEEELTLKGLLKKNIPNMIELFGTMTLALVLLLGFFLFAAAMKNPLLKIAESLKVELRNRDAVQNGGAGTTTNKVKEERIKVESERNKPTHFVLNTDEQDRSVKVLVRTLKEKPHVFINSIGKDQRDALGVKRLLPLLVVEDVPPLGDLLGHSILLRLEREGHGKLPMDDYEFDTWLKTFSERITLGSIKKGNVLTRMLNPKVSDKLFSSTAEQLMIAAKEVDSGLAYKLVMDFLPPDMAEKLIDDLNSTNRWEMLIEDQTLDLKSVEETAKLLIDHIDHVKTSASIATPQTTMQEVLLNPLVQYLKGRDLKTVEQFMTQIESVASNLATEMKKVVWTPKMIFQIPAPFMTTYMKDLEVDSKFLLVWGMPKEVSEYLYSLVPEGKVKMILDDKLSRNTATEKSEQYKEAQDFCREVLKDLQAQLNEGKYKLVENKEDDFVPPVDTLPDQSEIDEAGGDGKKVA